jgi:hypothetical protein
MERPYDFLIVHKEREHWDIHTETAFCMTGGLHVNVYTKSRKGHVNMAAVDHQNINPSMAIGIRTVIRFDILNAAPSSVDETR